MTLAMTMPTPYPADSFSSVRRAIGAVAAGEPIILVNGEDCDSDGALVIAAELVTAKTMSFVVRHTSGLVCVALPSAECDRLNLPPMCGISQDRHGLSYAVTVDAAQGTTTGISSGDRARTAQVLADTHSQPADLVRPGHIIPIRAHDEGVLARFGNAEAAVDLTRLAGVSPAGVIGEVVSLDDPRRMAHRSELMRFAADHGLHAISIADLVRYRRISESAVASIA